MGLIQVSQGCADTAEVVERGGKIAQCLGRFADLL